MEQEDLLVQSCKKTEHSTKHLAKLVQLICQGATQDVKSFLMENDVNLNQTDSTGRTCLGYAAQKGNNDLITLLVARGAQLDMFDFYHQTPIHYSTNEGHTKSVVLLLKKGSDGNAFKSVTPLHVAAMRGHVEIADILLKANCNINATNRMGVTPLHCAVSNEQREMVHMLLERGAAVDMVGISHKRTALLMAVESGDLEIVKDLVNHGARLNLCDTYGYSALTTACLHNFTDIATFLAKRGARVNIKDHELYLPLHYSARCGNSVIVSLLLEKGSMLNELTKYGDTALHLAGNQGHVEVVNLLVEKGCDTTTCDPHTELQPVHTAVTNLMDPEVFGQVLDVLVRGGCDLDAHSNTPWQTALFCAVDQAKSAFALLLLSYGANPQIEDNHGITLLHKACIRNMLSVIDVIIKGGLIDWRMEGWLDRDIFHSGINPHLVADYPPNIPPALLKNIPLYFDIMAVRHNVLALASICRCTIRKALRTKLKSKLESMTLPTKLKKYILFND